MMETRNTPFDAVISRLVWSVAIGDHEGAQRAFAHTVRHGTDLQPIRAAIYDRLTPTAAAELIAALPWLEADEFENPLRRAKVEAAPIADAPAKPQPTRESVFLKTRSYRHDGATLQAIRDSFSPAGQVDSIVAGLAADGWLIAVDRPTGGRPAKRYFAVGMGGWRYGPGGEVVSNWHPNYNLQAESHYQRRAEAGDPLPDWAAEWLDQIKAEKAGEWGPMDSERP